MAKYQLTQPKTKNSSADYYGFLISVYNGRQFSYTYVKDRLHKYMTFQALCEAGLLKYKNKLYEITAKGKMYVETVKSGNYTKLDLNNVLKGF